MILVDTSVWIEHLREGNATLVDLLEHAEALIHPSIIGELALGNLNERREVIDLLHGLPPATSATPDEILAFVEHHELYGVGIGYVDAQLLAATLLTDDASLWTTDRRLATAASMIGCAFEPT